MLISFTFFFLLGIDAQEYAVLRYLLGHRLPFAPAAVLIAQVERELSFFLLPLAILLFPDGQLTAPRWWWVLSAYAVVSGSSRPQRLRSGDRRGGGARHPHRPSADLATPAA